MGSWFELAASGKLGYTLGGRWKDEKGARTLANIGYIQVVRHCNHFCGFCSNPTSPYTHDLNSMSLLVDDLVKRGYYGVILTGGEPTLHPELPEIAAYARKQGLHVRMITNGHRLADASFAQDMAKAGLQLVHVSVYSTRASVEEELRGVSGSLERAIRAVENAHAAGIAVNINCVINAYNADHLDESIRYWMEHHPYIGHFVWNNLDPSMGRAETNQERFTPRLADFEASLHRAMTLLHESGRTFRVEKVPLCYMTDFAWASTETRKIVKMEERIVHFLDDKQTVRQTDWDHLYSEGCEHCSLRNICGGLFDRGQGYDPAELSPVFIPLEVPVRAILEDGTDPSFTHTSFDSWQEAFTVFNQPSNEPKPSAQEQATQVNVGKVTPRGLKLFESKRESESRRAERLGIIPERSS